MLEGGKFSVRMKKFLLLAVFFLAVSAGTVQAAQPEDALSSRPDDSPYYVVLRLEDTSRFLRWLVSRENINIIMPLILGSSESNSILGAVEIISAVIENTPLKSAALVIGMNKSSSKLEAPFFQMAFTVDDSVSSTVRKIAEGNASASDIAKLLLGNNNPIAAFAETMIKVVNEGNNIFRVDNELLFKAQDGMILLTNSKKEINLAMNSLKNSKSRLITNITRKFNTEDFMIAHIDYDVLFSKEGDKPPFNIKDLFEKPLNLELGFRRLTDKFILSVGGNFREAMKNSEQLLLSEKNKVKGGNIDLRNTGGKSSPLIAVGTWLDFSKFYLYPEIKPALNRLLRNLRNRFGINGDDFTNTFKGPFSLVVNDSVMIEGFKIPAVYISQTGIKGSASKVFSQLTKSPHFSKVQDGILQIDSSLSPISCLVSNKGDTLGIDFAELSSLQDNPDTKPAMNELMSRASLASMWVDFEGIQSWLNDDANGVFTALAPIGRLMGYGKQIDAAREVLGAKLSVPSVSLWADSPETYHLEFAIDNDVKPEDGLLAKLVKVYRDFNAKK